MPEGEIRLEILDERGNVIRSFTSETAGESSARPRSFGAQGWKLESVGAPALEKGAGMHRLAWDLRHAGPWDPEKAQSGRGGPMAAPGTYQARLSAGEWSRSVPFEVKMDPRVAQVGAATEADVAAQLELALKARDALSSARLAATRIGDALKQSPGDAALLEIQRELVAAVPPAGSVWKAQPMILDHLEYVYENLTRADQRPGQDVYERYHALESALRKQLEKLDGTLGSRTDTIHHNGPIL
jgi:hypothetical protein